MTNAPPGAPSLGFGDEAREGLDGGAPLLGGPGPLVEDRQQEVGVEGQHDGGREQLRIPAGRHDLRNDLGQCAGEALVEVEERGDDVTLDTLGSLLKVES